MTTHDRHPFLRRLMVLGSASCSCTSRPASFGGRARTIAQKFSPVLKKRESLEPCLSGLSDLPLPFLYCNRPSFVVAPAPSNLQISGRESFESKSTSFNELAGRFIIRLNVRLKPM